MNEVIARPHPDKFINSERVAVSLRLKDEVKVWPMSPTRSYRAVRSGPDHFEPSDNDDPKSQQQLHAKLEQIDYTAYAANRKSVAENLGTVDTGQFERLAAVAAEARCQWIAAAFAVSSGPDQPSGEQVDKLAELRTIYDELTAAYDALRRLVERGYLAP